MILSTLLLQNALDAMFSWSFSTAPAGMSAFWLVIRLSFNVEPSKLIMAVITF